jgi:hypothetical protein
VAGHFYFPTINIAFTLVPKTGCTTVKNYLYALEKLASATNPVTPQSFLGQAIHFSAAVGDYEIEDISNSTYSTALKILVLRNPYQRALSAWANKFLYLTFDIRRFHKYRDENFTPNTFNSIAELDKQFEDFTWRLANDTAFLFVDEHWKPQSEFIKDLGDYDLILETGQLSKLPIELETVVSKEYLDLVGEVPRFNETSYELLDYLGNDRTWGNLSLAYSEDLLMVQSVGLSTEKPHTKAKPDKKLESELVGRGNSQALESRRSAEIQSLRRRLDNVYSSKSWKLTAWLRWLDRKLTGKPM